jgi:hypothetical protein
MLYAVGLVSCLPIHPTFDTYQTYLPSRLKFSALVALPNCPPQAAARRHGPWPVSSTPTAGVNAPTGAASAVSPALKLPNTSVPSISSNSKKSKIRAKVSFKTYEVCRSLDLCSLCLVMHQR